jgi:hypothetical protein
MFNPFKKKRPLHPAELFSHYTEKEKLLILALMFAAAISDTSTTNNPENEFLDIWINNFEVPVFKVRTYIQNEDPDDFTSRLDALDQEKQEMAIMLIYGICDCDGGINRDEMDLLLGILSEIGMSQQYFKRLLDLNGLYNPFL